MFYFKFNSTKFSANNTLICLNLYIFNCFLYRFNKLAT